MKAERKFDCIEMQDRAGLAIHEKTKNLSRDELVAYWRARDEALRRRYKATERRQTKKT